MDYKCNVCDWECSYQEESANDPINPDDPTTVQTHYDALISEHKLTHS
jgi:hypothetical protein